MSRVKCPQTGFTLVELLVASAIFTVVSIVAVGAIITINDANRKTQAIRAIVDNLNYSLESMSRKLRTGTNYTCAWSTDTNWTKSDPPTLPTISAPRGCTNPSEGAQAMAFTSAENINAGIGGQTVFYRFVGQDYCTVGVTGCKGKIQTWDVVAQKVVDMTPPEIDIKDLHFYVQTTGQPRVLITVAGIIRLAKGNIDTPFNIQTTVTQRLKNF